MRAAREEWEFDRKAGQTIAERTEESRLNRRLYDEIARHAAAHLYSLGQVAGLTPEQVADFTVSWRREWDATS